MIYKEYKNNTYNIYTIKTDKFKTCHMEIVFRNNIKKEDITKRVLLSELIVENSRKYNTRKKMMIKLEDLYNSSFYAVNNRVGSSIITSFCFDFINPLLVSENIDEFIKFPLESLLNPNVKNNEFDITTFNYIKERQLKEINSIIENPKAYSIDKLLNKMCKDTESSININGYIEDLEDINNVNIYYYYKYMLEHDYIDIYIIGSLDMDLVYNIINNIFKLNILKQHDIKYEVKNKINKKELVIKEKFNCSQENICFGLNIINMSDYEKKYVANIYNMILGGNSLESKLYNRLRNENSLCYNCVSIYQKFDNLIIIHTAVSNENESLAISLIKQALKDVIMDLSNDEIEDAKSAIKTSLNMSYDNPGRIIDNYLFKNITNLDNLDVRIKKYNEVTKEDIINFAKKIKINTILCLKGDLDEKDKN